MKQVTIDSGKCRWNGGKCDCGRDCDCPSEGSECEGCAEACPSDAITREDKIVIDHELCTLCGACVDACPFGAMSIREL